MLWSRYPDRLEYLADHGLTLPAELDVLGLRAAGPFPVGEFNLEAFRRFAEVIPDAFVRLTALAGEPEEVAAQLQMLFEAGATEVMAFPRCHPAPPSRACWSCTPEPRARSLDRAQSPSRACPEREPAQPGHECWGWVKSAGLTAPPPVVRDPLGGPPRTQRVDDQSTRLLDPVERGTHPRGRKDQMIFSAEVLPQRGARAGQIALLGHQTNLFVGR